MRYPEIPDRLFRGHLRECRQENGELYLEYTSPRESVSAYGNAGSYTLTAVPEDLFANNPDIVNLEQAFAGCVKLISVPDGILSGLTSLKTADAMFAFCKRLEKLPASYLESPHSPRYDFFAGAPVEAQKEAAA